MAIILPNGIDICIATYAAHAAGAQVVPLNPLYTERELEAILADAAPAVLIYDAAKHALTEPLAQRLRIPHSLAIEAGAGRLTKWKGEIRKRSPSRFRRPRTSPSSSTPAAPPAGRRAST